MAAVGLGLRRADSECLGDIRVWHVLPERLSAAPGRCPSRGRRKGKAGGSSEGLFELCFKPWHHVMPGDEVERCTVVSHIRKRRGVERGRLSEQTIIVHWIPITKGGMNEAN